MNLQMLLSGKGWGETDWTWLDELEQERWGEKRDPSAGPRPKRKSVKELFEEARARPVSAEDKLALKAFADGGYKSEEGRKHGFG